MAASPAEHDVPPSPEADAPGSEPERRFPIGRVLGVTVMLILVLFWIWIFSGAPRKQNPDYLADRSWVADSEATCAEVMAVIDERDNRELEGAARADDVDTSTAELRAMLDDLRSPPPETADDRALVDQWLADWETLLADRDAYTAALREDPEARFLTTEKFNDPIGKVIETFADVNEMPACGPSGDVG